jgi:hypothetical protein
VVESTALQLSPEDLALPLLISGSSAEGVLTRPPEIITLAREVKAAGVRIIASTDALKQQKISPANLDPQPTDLVDDPATLMAELVSQKHQVIRY